MEWRAPGVAAISQARRTAYCTRLFQERVFPGEGALLRGGQVGRRRPGGPGVLLPSVQVQVVGRGQEASAPVGPGLQRVEGPGGFIQHPVGADLLLLIRQHQGTVLHLLEFSQPGGNFLRSRQPGVEQRVQGQLPAVLQEPRLFPRGEGRQLLVQVRGGLGAAPVPENFLP